LQADSGMPTVVAHPQSEVTQLYRQIALQVAAKIALKAKDFSSKFPSIKISKDT
jgi:ATP-binding protein involved in chromosome partitioning